MNWAETISCCFSPNQILLLIFPAPSLCLYKTLQATKCRVVAGGTAQCELLTTCCCFLPFPDRGWFLHCCEEAAPQWKSNLTLERESIDTLSKCTWIKVSALGAWKDVCSVKTMFVMGGNSVGGNKECVWIKLSWTMLHLLKGIPTLSLSGKVNTII